MPACATQEKVTDSPLPGNLFLPVPDTDFRDYLDEVHELIQFAPEIIGVIERDLDTNAREKKLLRVAHRRENSQWHSGPGASHGTETPYLRTEGLSQRMGSPMA